MSSHPKIVREPQEGVNKFSNKNGVVVESHCFLLHVILRGVKGLLLVFFAR